MSQLRQARPRPGPGRPPSTSREEVGRIALELFARDGFEETTMEDIAAATGVGRRTLFRYFPSKNDIVWGDFDAVLDRLRRELHSGPKGESTFKALRRAMIASNSYPPELLDELRIRITLITTVPALQAHSMLKYREWRQVIAEFVAERSGGSPGDLMSLVVAEAALGTAMASFEIWTHDASLDHEELIGSGWDALSDLRHLD